MPNGEMNGFVGTSGAATIAFFVPFKYELCVIVVAIHKIFKHISGTEINANDIIAVVKFAWIGALKKKEGVYKLLLVCVCMYVRAFILLHSEWRVICLCYVFHDICYVRVITSIC